MSNQNHSGKTDILLVSDNPEESALVLKVLKKAKIINRLHLLASPNDILDFLFRTGSYKETPSTSAETLVLLSLNLQSTSGIEVLRKIKSDSRSRELPIILLASSQEECGVMEGYKLGANACIVHPIEITKFIEAVAELHLNWLLISENHNSEAR